MSNVKTKMQRISHMLRESSVLKQRYKDASNDFRTPIKNVGRIVRNNIRNEENPILNKKLRKAYGIQSKVSFALNPIVHAYFVEPKQVLDVILQKAKENISNKLNGVMSMKDIQIEREIKRMVVCQIHREKYLSLIKEPNMVSIMKKSANICHNKHIINFEDNENDALIANSFEDTWKNLIDKQRCLIYKN